MKGFGITNMLRATQLGLRNSGLARRTTPTQLRWNSSSAKPVSPHVNSTPLPLYCMMYTNHLPQVGFYKTFTRPIAKVMLMAVFTYQVAYWSWIKLEKDEIKAQKSGESALAGLRRVRVWGGANLLGIAEIKELEDELQKLIKLAEEAGIKVKP